MTSEVHDLTIENAPSPASGKRVKRRGRKTRLLTGIGLGILGLGMIGAACGLLLAHQTTTVRDELQRVVTSAPQLRAQLQDGRMSEAQSTFASMQEQTQSARATASGPLWKVAALIPILGPNFQAVTEASVTADDVASRAIAPLMDKYESLDWRALSPTDGRIDVRQLQNAAPSIATAAKTVRLSHERLAAIETGRDRKSVV